MDATSYFARIALANHSNVKIVKDDFWIFFPFSTQVKIIQYLIINFPKRVFCHPLPFGKNKKAIKQKRKLLLGLKKMADIREVVANNGIRPENFMQTFLGLNETRCLYNRK